MDSADTGPTTGDDIAKLERRARRLELLSSLSQELHSERDLDRLLEKVWVELTEVLEAERSSLFLVDEEADELYSVIAQQEEEIRIPRGAGIAGSVAVSGKPMLIEDAYRDPRFNSEVDRKTGFRTRSVLAVPLKNASGVVLGVCQVLNRRDGHPFDREDMRLLEALAAVSGSAIETLRLVEEQNRATEATIAGLVMALEMRVPKEREHSLVVRAYSRALALQLGLSGDRARRIEWAAALHDVGKLAVPDSVLNKESALDDEENIAYESHAAKTARFLEAMSFSGELRGVERIAPFHHKKYAGGGYPEEAPAGRELPLGSRIIAVADALWVAETPRWGRKALSREQALEKITQGSGREFDPSVVEALRQAAPQLDDLVHGALLRTHAQEGGGR